MKTFGHKRPRRDSAGNVIELKDSPAQAVTVSTLDSRFGCDRGKRLVVSLQAGDLIALRIARSSRSVSITAADLYFHCLKCQANLKTLQKARARKEAKAVRLAQLRQERAEKKLFTRTNGV